jgi:hypothetical protein
MNLKFYIRVIAFLLKKIRFNVILGAKKLIEKHKPTIIVEIFDITPTKKKNETNFI